MQNILNFQNIYTLRAFAIALLCVNAYTLAFAATPDIRLTQGAVQKTSSAEVFDPVSIGPVGVTAYGSGSCSRFSPAGVVNSNMIAAQPFNSNTSGYLPNNTYTILATIENRDAVSLYKPRYSFQAPVETQANTSDLCIVRGDGVVLTSGVDYTVVNLGFDAVEVWFATTASATLAPYNATSGANIFFIFFDVGLYGTRPVMQYPAPDIVLPGEVTYVSLTAGGGNDLVGSVTDSTTMAVKNFVSITSATTTSSLPYTIGGVTIGELINYRVEIRIPELGTTTASIGSAFRLQQYLAPSTVIYDNNGAISTPYTLTASSSLQEIPTGDPITTGAYANIFPPGDLVDLIIPRFENNDNNVSTVETIVVEFTAVLLDDPGLMASTTSFLSSSPTLEYEAANNLYFISGSSVDVKPLEPNLFLKTVSTSTTNASSTVDFVFELYHRGVSLSDAQEVSFYLQTDGPGLASSTISNVVVTGLAPATTTIGSLLLQWPSVPATISSTSPITISFTATLNSATTSTSTIAYPVGMTSRTTPGTSLTPLSSFNALSRARSYVGTTTVSTTYFPLVSTPASTSTPTTTPITTGGGGYNNPGCMDPLALNYDKWATSNNGSCTYPVGVASTSPSILPTVLPGIPPVLPASVLPTSPGTPIASTSITYIPSNKRKLVLEITGALSANNTKLRQLARQTALKNNTFVEIPSLKVRQPVLELPTLEPLLNESWILPDGSTPDKGGNTVLVGHSYNKVRGVYSKNTFFDLDTVGIGEMITIFWKGKKYTYQVVDNDQFAPEDVWLEDNTVESILTIYTCGKYTTDYRQVVRARLIDM